MTNKRLSMSEIQDMLAAGEDPAAAPADTPEGGAQAAPIDAGEDPAESATPEASEAAQQGFEYNPAITPPASLDPALRPKDPAVLALLAKWGIDPVARWYQQPPTEQFYCVMDSSRRQRFFDSLYEEARLMERDQHRREVAKAFEAFELRFRDELAKTGAPAKFCAWCGSSKPNDEPGRRARGCVYKYGVVDDADAILERTRARVAENPDMTIEDLNTSLKTLGKRLAFLQTGHRPHPLTCARDEDGYLAADPLIAYGTIPYTKGKRYPLADLETPAPDGQPASENEETAEPPAQG